MRYALENADFHSLGHLSWGRPKDGFIWVDNFDWAISLHYGGWVPSLEVAALKAARLFRGDDTFYNALFGLEAFINRLVFNDESPDLETAAKEAGPYLLPRTLVDSRGMDSGEWERTFPLEENPTLFLEFAKLKANDPEALLTFANRWGMLRPPSPKYVLLAHDVAETWVGQLETLWDWQKAIWDMKRLVALWEMLKKAEEMEDDRELKQHFRRDKGRKSINYVYEAENGSWLAAVTLNEIEYESIKADDYTAAARYLLTSEINSKLSENKVQFRLLWDRKKQDSKPHAVAVNLLGAMYYQFYDAVRSGRHFKKCVVCGKWERVERSTWLYHDSCGSTWRNRKRRGLEAIRKGKKTTAQLAVELGVDAATVEAWIK